MATAPPAAPAAPTQEKMQELVAAAVLKYSLKDFETAASLYSQAAEIQGELNGELAPQNAELLFYYGRALYKTAVQNSSVLGGKATQEEKKKKKSKSKNKAPEEAKKEAPEDKAGAKSNPFFQMTGDENWTDSDQDSDADGNDDGEDVEEGEGAAEDEEKDDFQNAYEVFEMARVCYTAQLEALQAAAAADADKAKAKAELTPEERAVKDKLADCHGFLAEISLENERFQDAADEARQSLALQQELHPFDHENVTEAHYLLSLALELGSTNNVREAIAAEDQGVGAQEVDYDLRNEAAKHTELAIQSCEARLKIENDALENGAKTMAKDALAKKKAYIKDKTEALEDLKTRLIDLKADPKSQTIEGIDPSALQGLLASAFPVDAAKLQEATKSANDISGLVKSKKKAPAPAADAGSSGSTKRKLEVEDATDGKRAKKEDIPE